MAARGSTMTPIAEAARESAVRKYGAMDRMTVENRGIEDAVSDLWSLSFANTAFICSGRILSSTCSQGTTVPGDEAVTSDRIHHPAVEVREQRPRASRNSRNLRTLVKLHSMCQMILRGQTM